MDKEDLQANMKILISMTLDKIGEDDVWLNGVLEATGGLDSVSTEDNERLVALEEKVDTVYRNQKLILDCMRKIASLL